MKGRLYVILDPETFEINLATSIESLGDGVFRYDSRHGAKVAYADDIMQFTTREEYQGGCFDQYCNDINGLIDKIWQCKFNPEYQKYILQWHKCSLFTMDKEQGCGWEEKYCPHLFRTMAGSIFHLYIGTDGSIFVKSKVCRIEWDKFLSSSSNGIIKLYTDAFKYIVTYQDDKGKPSKGYSKMANYISNYISAFPEGISSKDIECGLKLGHPTIAGRISEMDDMGRIKKIGSVKYCSRGKANSIWVISKE